MLGGRQRKSKKVFRTNMGCMISCRTSRSKTQQSGSHSFPWSATWMCQRRWKPEGGRMFGGHCGEMCAQIQRSRKQVKTDASGKVAILLAGRCCWREDLTTSSSPALACDSAASILSKASSWDVASCSMVLVFAFSPVPAPGLLKQLASSLASWEDCVCTAEKSCCSIASRWFEFPTEYRADVWSLSLRRSRDSLRRFSSCNTILLPAVSTATPQEPPYCPTNLSKRKSISLFNWRALSPQSSRPFSTYNYWLWICK